MMSGMTTMRLGGPAGRLVLAKTEAQLVSEIRSADSCQEPLAIIGGGSNVVVADSGFSGTVIQVLTRGMQRTKYQLNVAAGESWDAFVAHCVKAGLSGVERLSGIPGTVGATPIQNVGAYGQEVSEVIVSVRAYDRKRSRIVDMNNSACGFSYRSSRFKSEPGRWVVLEVVFALSPSMYSSAAFNPALAAGLPDGGRGASLLRTREAILELRRARGMVLDPDDFDTWSVGSFFLNPFVTEAQFAEIEQIEGVKPPGEQASEHEWKIPAAWLIERAGFYRGYGDPDRAAISTKHSLALTNRGRASTADVVSLAREISGGVFERFGVKLQPEAVFIGHGW